MKKCGWKMGFLLGMMLFNSLGFSSPSIGAFHDVFKNLIENTVWIVPPATLSAYEYSSGSGRLISDQTVWVIDSYSAGYFTGKAYAAFNQTPASVSDLVGSVTNSGVVYITFYPSSNSGAQLINGIGEFKKEQGTYRFIMQMNSGSSSVGISHWSYMISVTPDNPLYQSLPGTGGMSVPEFISSF